MTSKQIRQQFLEFFQQHRHTIVPSASVIPYDDPTLLFTNAGMNQFKDVFLATGKRDYTRAADSQKCIRVSGKHNDLEEVGRDTYHHTFFEMLGNWSFGDYYKKEAIEWAWELLTKVWGLDKKRLHATVFETDDEAYELWKQVTDISHDHIHRFGKKDNFWEMGETGPCGPCSEIHIDQTADLSGGNLVNAGDPRVMEIWNLVFIQYNRDASGNLTPLPSKHVDTGMGFERICAVLQGKKSNYDTDVFTPLIQRIEEITSKKYSYTIDTQNTKPETQTDIAMRVIADHVRMLSFSIADGGIPSNEGRGYVMRRILRRAARFGRNLGMHEPFLHSIVGALVQSMGEQYPEIKERQAHIERVIKGEEESFNVTLDRGIEIHTAEVQRCKNAGAQMFSGEVAFKLHDTFGFPFDMTAMMAGEVGLTVDHATFDALMAEQKERARQAQSDKSIHHTVGSSTFEEKTKFLGYDHNMVSSEVLDFEKTNDGVNLVLRESPFYTESGGQVADTGVILLPSGVSYQISDVYKNPHGAIIHVLPGSIEVEKGQTVKLQVDLSRRQNIMRNHTATHIFHEALRRVIGDHSHQQGSLVSPDYLRFDFNHFEKVNAEQIKIIEEIVNEKIADAITVEAENDPSKWMNIEEAKKRYPSLKMFFGDKYGDKVRVVVVDPKFSVELCGGTHVGNTKDIGLFKIISEGSVASGIRRIEAVTGEGLTKYIRQQVEKAGQLDEQIAKLIEEQENLQKQLGVSNQNEANLKSGAPRRLSINLGDSVTVNDITAVETALQHREQAIEQITKSTHDLQKELSKSRLKEAASGLDGLIAQAKNIRGVNAVVAKIESSSADEMKNLGDSLRLKLGSGVGVIASVIEDKVFIVCVVTDDLMKKLPAGKIVGDLAKKVGGGGGGRPHLATAGGKDVDKIDEMLGSIPGIIETMLG